MSDTPNYADVPADYPSNRILGSVSGFQPKLIMRPSSDGKFYNPGCTPEERWADWQYSLQLVTAMAQKCLESKAGKRADMSEADIIQQYYERAVAANGRYGSANQLQWVFTKVAEQLGWPLPDACRLCDI